MHYYWSIIYVCYVTPQLSARAFISFLLLYKIAYDYSLIVKGKILKWFGEKIGPEFKLSYLSKDQTLTRPV